MSERRSGIDDKALDAAIEEVARVEAPPDLMARVRASLDAADSRRAGGLVFGRRPQWALALSTAALVLAAAWWLRPAVVGPAVVRSAVGPSVIAPGAVGPDAVGRGTVVGPNLSSAAGPAAGSAKAGSSASRTRPVTRPSDHERALPSLAGPADLEQAEIDPDSLVVPALKAVPAHTITPLTIDTDGRDENGRGESR